MGLSDLETGERKKPVIQVLGKARCGKTTFISQLMNHSINDGRYERTTSLVQYTANIRLSEFSELRPVVPLSYTVNIFDVPGETTNKIDNNSFEYFLLKNITQPDISPLSEEAIKSHKYMSHRRLKHLAKATNLLGDVKIDEEETTHLLTEHIEVDVDSILAGRMVLTRQVGTARTNLNGGYIVMFDMGDPEGSFQKAKALVTRIRSQSVLVPIALFSNKMETSRTRETKQIRDDAMKFAYNNDAAFFEGSALMNYVTIDPRNAIPGAPVGHNPEKKVDSIVNWIMHRMLTHENDTPEIRPPESDVVCCAVFLKYTICLPFVVLNKVFTILLYIICCQWWGRDKGDANDL